MKRSYRTKRATPAWRALLARLTPGERRTLALILALFALGFAVRWVRLGAPL